jgi:hypothetical protein
MQATGTDLGAWVADALERAVAAVQVRLVEVQAELDDIGPTFGMQWRRTQLNREKNELLDQLLSIRGALLEPARA